jgi:transposase InsO family protein
VEDLTRSDDGEAVMTYTTYEKLASRKRLNKIDSGGGLGRRVQIEYSSLPERFRRRFEAKYGDPEELLRQDKPALVINAEARRFFAGIEPGTFRLPNGETLPDDKVEEYTLNASVLDVLHAEVEKQRLGRNRLKQSTRIIWENILASAERLRADFHHTLPNNEARLKDKVRTYEREGFICLVSKKFCNANKTKITPEGGRLLIALRRSRVPVYTLRQIFDEYNRRAERKGWKTLESMNSVTSYLERPDVAPKWWAAVYGELSARQKFDRKQQTILPGVRDALWYGDGTKLNLYYKGRDKDGCLVKKTVMVYEVIDAYSEMLLGYSIGETENAELQRRAFRMAIETAGHKPFEIVTDNQGGQKTTDSLSFMSRICHITRKTAPHTPQAKSIESVFGRFQREVLHADWRFTGQNITATSRDSRPNSEFIGANVDNLYTFEEMCAAYADYRQRWNDLRHPESKMSRREMYLRSQNPEAPALSQYDYMEMFWSVTERPSEFTSSGITIQVAGQRYSYEVLDAEGHPDMEFRRSNTTRKFFVRYDPDDMTRVWLCTKPAVGGLRMVVPAVPYAVVHRAIQEQTPEEQAFLRETLEANKRERILRQMEGYELEVAHGVAPEQHGLRTPRLQGLSSRAQERLLDRYADAALSDCPPQEERCEPIAVGQVEKQISNMTFDEVSLISKF